MQTYNKFEFNYHPDYGLTDDIRKRTCKLALSKGVRQAAYENNVSKTSVYNWLNHLKDYQNDK